jgi:hypothetical protein
MTKELNLDAFIKPDGLWDIYTELSHVRLSSKKYGLTVKDIKLYRAYACNKAVAMRLRIEGNINQAMEYESICDRIYNRMSIKHW